MLNAVGRREIGLEESKFRHNFLVDQVKKLQCTRSDCHEICDEEMHQYSPLSMDWHSEGNLLMASDEGGFLRVFQLDCKRSSPIHRKSP